MSDKRKQPRPKWPAYRLTPEWQGLVQERLDDLEWERQDLAARIGVTPGAITHLLKHGSKTSRCVEPTCEVLEIPPPFYEDARDREAVWLMRELRRRDPRGFDRTLDRVRRVLGDIDES